MKRSFYMKCEKCGYLLKDIKGQAKCPACGNVLKYFYENEDKLNQENIVDKRFHNIWKFNRLLPVQDLNNIISLGEGNTPFHSANNLRELFDFSGNIYLKDETQNSTGTYKDRPASIGVSKAVECGYKSVIIASDGNAGPAVAAYAARAKIPCFVVMPRDTPDERNIQTLAYGAKLILVENATVSECIDMIEEINDNTNSLHLTTAAAVNPYHVEGTKTVGLEIAENMNWKTPDWVISPVGGAGLLASIWKSFVELKNANIVDRLPRILGVQAAGCAPVVKAFENGDKEVEWWRNPSTIATAIGVPYPLDGEWALEAIYSSNGYALSLEDKEFVEAARLLAKTEGVLAEPTAAASIGGLMKAKKHGVISEDADVVCVITGTGLKALNSFKGKIENIPVIGPRKNELRKQINFFE